VSIISLTVGMITFLWVLWSQTLLRQLTVFLVPSGQHVEHPQILGVYVDTAFREVVAYRFPRFNHHVAQEDLQAVHVDPTEDIKRFRADTEIIEYSFSSCFIMKSTDDGIFSLYHIWRIYLT
jgi:hypothetical protein